MPKVKRTSNSSDKSPEKSRKKKKTNFEAVKVFKDRATKRINGWSDREVLHFAVALQRFGSSDPKKIAEIIQTKDESAVKSFLEEKNLYFANDYAREKEWPPHVKRRCLGNWFLPDPVEVMTWSNVRKWRRVMYNQMPSFNTLSNYSKTMLKDLLEKFYDEAEEPSNSQVINVKAIYKYLLDCVCGYVPAEMSPINSGVVLMLLGQLKEMTRNLDFDEEKHFARTFKRARPFAPIKIKAETTKTDNCSSNEHLGQSSNDVSDAILVEEEMYQNLIKHRNLVQGFNPLNVPLWTLVKEQAYMQNKCETAPRISVKPELNTSVAFI